MDLAMLIHVLEVRHPGTQLDDQRPEVFTAEQALSIAKEGEVKAGQIDPVADLIRTAIEIKILTVGCRFGGVDHLGGSITPALLFQDLGLAFEDSSGNDQRQ